jgi:hypothetical protein
MRIYAVIIVALVAVILALVKLAYLHGEITHVSKQSAAAPAVPAVTATPSSLVQKWRSTDRPATGDPYAEGIVVTFSAHTVNGRDALTGVVRWHYTRSDETICTVAQQDDSTIAFYDRHGNCDEITAFSTATGVPTFYRTSPDNGVGAVATASNVVMVLTPAAVHVFDNAGGIDRWTWNPPSGCTAQRAVIGSAGILISSRCGAGYRLTLHDLTETGEIWSVTSATPQIPIAASTVISAVDPDSGVVSTFAVSNGASTRRFTLTDPTDVRADAPADASTGVSSTAEDLFWVGELSAIASPGRLAWTAPADNPATVTPQGLLAVVNGAGVSLLNPASGTVNRVVSLSPAPPSAPSLAFTAGGGLVIAAAGTAYYG